MTILMRRHHRQRLLKNRSKYWIVHTGTKSGMLLNTPCPCSCWMCGNPRKVFKGKDISTRQEKKAALKFED